ncbi:hypothetical protein V8C42DRAFT_106835 [Trichoderma barbatum]
MTIKESPPASESNSLLEKGKSSSRGTSTSRAGTGDTTSSAMISTTNGATDDPPVPLLVRKMTKIEHFPQGYPRFSAFLASANSFQLWRRFSTLRTRLLLIKQDELSQLEQQLLNIDGNEEHRIYLGSIRDDANDERASVLKKINDALIDYDSVLERYQRALSFQTASERAISNPQNWLDGNAAIAEDEMDYLKHNRDLVSLMGNTTWSERLAERIGKLFASDTHAVTRDKNVNVSPTWVRKAVMILLAPIIATLLLTPVIICNYIDDLTHRVIVVVLTTAAFIAALACLTRVRAIDLVVAGATYATVLVVFISGTNGAGSLK